MRLGEWLVHNGALTPEQVQTVLAFQSQWKCKFGEALLALNLIPREPFLRLLAGHLKVPFIRSEEMDKVPSLTIRKLPADVLARLRVCPLRIQQTGSRGTVYMATHRPEDLKFLDEVSFATGCTVLPVLALPEDVERTLLRHGIIEGRYLEPIELPPEDDFRVEHTRLG